MKKCYSFVWICFCFFFWSAQAMADWQMSPRFVFDSDNQRYHMMVDLNSCGYDYVNNGNVTPYVHIDGIDSYAANHRWGRTIQIRGEFEAEKEYSIRVDGQICGLKGMAKSQLKSPPYPAALQFLSSGLYFSKLNPQLRFRYRSLDSIDWKIHRIAAKERYLLTRTENLDLSKLQASGSTDITQKDIDYFRHLDSFPTTLSEFSHTYPQAKDWAYASLDLSKHFKKGDWLVLSTNRGANKVIQFTDIGLYLRKNQEGLWGQTLRLENGTPEPAKILLKQKNGETLTSFYTDVEGTFHFKWDTPEKKGLLQKLNRIEAQVGDDSVELLIQEESIALSSFPTSGIDQRASAYQAFVYSDRGLYRLGDTVHLTTLVRDWQQNAPKETLSLDFDLYSPQGKIKHTVLKKGQENNGGETWTWQVPTDATTGRYLAEVSWNGKVIGKKYFSVEQIIPPSIEGELAFDPGQTFWEMGSEQNTSIQGHLKSRFLFGAPAANKRWEYRCVLKPGKLSPVGLEDFVFEDHLKVFPDNTFAQYDGLKLDAEGEGAWQCPNERSLTDAGAHNQLPGIGKLEVVANVFEEGGRSITVGGNQPVYFHNTYPGIKPLFEGNLEYGEKGSFQVVAVDPRTGQAVPGVKLKVELFEKDYWGWYYFHRNNDKVVDSELTRKLIQSDTIVSKTEPVLYSVTPPSCCDWELRVTVEGQKVSARVAFRNGWWSENSGMGSSIAQKITFTPDKPRYSVGETAHVLLNSPFDGEMVVLHEKDGNSFQRDRVQIRNQKAEYSFKVTQAHSPWFQLAGVVMRTTTSAQTGFQATRETPFRALGMTQIQANDPKESLDFALNLPVEGRPESDFNLEIQALGSDGNPLSEETWMTVSVVDEGILSLIRFKTPDPYQGLHRRPQYQNQWFDSLGLVIPYTLHQGESAFGGDENLLDALKNVKRVKPMAWWSGVVKTNADGKLSLTVPINDYTGRVRVMVVGWSNQRTGSTEKSLPVLAPVDLITSLPRVMGAEDQSFAVAEVFNNSDSSQRIETTLSLSGPLQLAETGQAMQSLIIEPKRSQVLQWPIEGTGVPGVGKVNFFARNAQGDERMRSTEMVVRPLAAPQQISSHFLLKPGELWEQRLPHEHQFAPNTGQWEVNLSRSPAIKLGEHIQGLVSYPYGCAEQTTSRLLAMLLLKPTMGEKALTDYLGEGKTGKIKQYIEAGIKKLEEMQMADGGFAYWKGANYQYPWINAYATHFLWEAQRRNYSVPQTMYRKALKKLRSQSHVKSYGIDTVAYSNFVLSLNGQVNKSKLLSLVKELKRFQQTDRVILPGLGRVFTAGAAIKAGHRLPSYFLADLPDYTTETARRAWWREHHFLSSEGGQAVKFYGRALLGEKGAVSESLQFLDQLAERRYVSTHTVAWSLLAVDALFPSNEEASTISVTSPDGNLHALNSAPGENRLKGNLKDLKSLVQLTNTDQNNNVFGSLIYRGYPKEPPTSSVENQIELTRHYMSEDGWLLQPPYSVPQGTRLFVVLTAKHQVSTLDSLNNVAIEDWLPAGLELENQRLNNSHTLPDLPPEVVQVPKFEVDHIDYLDDKITIFGALKKKFQVFFYPVRAVSQGIFKLMPLQAEAMYIPEVNATHIEPGTLTITPPAMQ